MAYIKSSMEDGVKMELTLSKGGGFFIEKGDDVQSWIPCNLRLVNAENTVIYQTGSTTTFNIMGLKGLCSMSHELLQYIEENGNAIMRKPLEEITKADFKKVRFIDMDYNCEIAFQYGGDDSISVEIWFIGGIDSSCNAGVKFSSETAALAVFANDLENELNTILETEDYAK